MEDEAKTREELIAELRDLRTQVEQTREAETHLRWVEESLRGSRLQLAEAMELAHIAYWEADPVTNDYTFSDPFYTLYGTTAEREGGYIMAMDEYVRRFIHPDDLPTFYGAAARNIADNSPEVLLTIEHRIIRGDGQVRHILARGRSFKDETGRPIRLYGANQDITELKEAEEALRTIQRQLSISMDMAHLVHWECDVPTAMFTFDDSFYALYGTTAEHEGGPLMSAQAYVERFVHPEDAKVVDEEIGKAIAARDPNYAAYLEHRIIRADGQERFITVRFRIIKDEAGNTIKTYGANQDITEWKQAMEALERSSERFRRIFDESPLGMALAGPDFRFFRTNAALTRMLGYTEQEMTLLTHEAVTHPEHVADNTLQFNKLVAGLIPAYRAENRYVRKDGKVIWGASTTYATRGEDNRAMNFFIMVEDITQRKASEEEKTRLESQLLRAQKMEAIGTLTGGIAHDFNNILTALVGYAGLLQMKMEKGVLRNYVDQVLSASQKATDLIKSLLAFSRQQTFSLSPVGINQLIRKTNKLLERLLTEDISIRILLAADEIAIMADETQIDQILFNLATNARDAMPQGGTLTIETKEAELDDEFQRFHGYGQTGRYAVLAVSDTGTGMDKATRERIFDPFFTTKELGKGTGLGLSTVYGIVKQHRGHISVYSEPGIGTTFRIYLPATNIPGDEERAQRAPVRGGKETILVAEDNDFVRDLIRAVLTEYGYTIIEATDGADAVDQFKNSDTIDLVILDSVMPNKNGREACDEIRRIKPDARVLFTSGYTRDVVLDKGIADEQFDFIPKPISPEALLRKVRTVLDRENPTPMQ